MATLEPLDRPGHGILLAARHLVGRSRACLLHIDNPQISGEHASIEWKGFGWEVRDLGSRNGTFVDGKRLAPGGRAPLVCGAVVQFAQSGSWKLVDDSAPVAMAVLVTEPGSSESAAVRAQDGILALPPDTEVPDVCIYQNSAGQWIAERHDGEDVIGDRDHVAVVSGCSGCMCPRAWPRPPESTSIPRRSTEWACGSQSARTRSTWR